MVGLTALTVKPLYDFRETYTIAVPLSRMEGFFVPTPSSPPVSPDTFFAGGCCSAF